MAEIINMPKLGFDMAEGTLVRWLKKKGESIEKGEILAEIETDKATVEVESPTAGVVRELLVDEDSVVPVNNPIAIVGTADEKIELPGTQEKSETKKTEPAVEAEKKPEQRKAVAEEPTQSGKIIVSPLARRIAREQTLDLEKIKGSGPGGRIVRRDVEAALGKAGTATEGSTAAYKDQGIAKTDREINLSRLRQVIGRRMTEAKNTIPHFYVTREIKMDALLSLREQFNRIVPDAEKVSVNDFIVKGVALALDQFPNINASLKGNSILHHGEINIGVAVSVEGGLLTVVCRGADKKPIRQIASEIRSMALRARQGKVKPEDIEASTFSISNLGMYEVDEFIAIINPPEAGILAVGAARQVPIVEQGTVTVGWRMKATISVDHRISDGAEAAQFMQVLANFLEEPLRLIL